MPLLRLIRRVCRCALSGGGAVALAFLPLQATPLSAQDLPAQATPAYLRIVEGTALLQRDVDTDTADVGMPFVPGDRLRTSRGRVEILFPDGTAVDVDEFSDVSLGAPQALRLEAGRVWISVPRESTLQMQIDTPAATAYSDGPGEFRLAVLGNRGPETELLVTTGRAELVADRGSVKLLAGERSSAVPNDVPSRPELFNARLDAFDHWALDQRNDRVAGRSGQYLPPDLRSYGGTLDEDGSWQYESSYGYVWYPSVAIGWHPYYSGYWATVPAYGWTWIGSERWAWPTHHYGRWGHAHKGWFWIPEQHWAPAWVSWGAAPGYVSWCPLGFDNRPVFAFSASAGATWGRGWVVLPRDRFGVRHEQIGHYGVAPNALPARTPFVMQSAPPVPASRAAVRRIQSPPQGQAGQAAGGGRGQAVPRGNGGRSGALTLAPSDRGAVTSRGNGPTRQPASPASRTPGTHPSTPDTIRDGNAGRTQPLPRTSAPQTRQPDSRRYPFGDFRRPDGGSTTVPVQGDGVASATTLPRAVPRPRTGDLQRSPDPQRVDEPQRNSSTSQRDGAYPRDGSYRGLPARPTTDNPRRPGGSDVQQPQWSYPAGARVQRSDAGAAAPARPASPGSSAERGVSGHDSSNGGAGTARRSPQGQPQGQPQPQSGSGSAGAVPRSGGASPQGGDGRSPGPGAASRGGARR